MECAFIVGQNSLHSLNFIVSLFLASFQNSTSTPCGLHIARAGTCYKKSKPSELQNLLADFSQPNLPQKGRPSVLQYSFLAWILKKSRVLTLIRSQCLGSLSSWLVQPKLTRKTLLKLLHPDWTWPCCRALEPFANPLPIKRKSLQLCFATNLNFKAEKLTGIAAVMALSPRTFALSSPCEPLLAGPCVLS